MSNENKPSPLNFKKDSSSDETMKNEVDIGALLSEARKNLDLSIGDIATHLNLSQVIINQLENNQFSGGLPLAFVRGYVTSYAMKVGLDIAMMKKAFDSQMGEESVSLKRVESLSVFEKNRNNFNSNNTSFKLITFLIVVVIIFFASKAGWEKYKSLIVADSDRIDLNNTNVNSNDLVLDLVLDRELGIDEISDRNKFSQNNNGESSASDLSGSEGSQVSGNGNGKIVVENIESSSSLEINLGSTSSEISTTGALVNESGDHLKGLEIMTLSFSADCWVRIVDASGNELAFGIKKVGKVMNLQGIPPFDVILGDPSVVELTYKGKAIELSRYQAKRRVKVTLQ